MASQKPKVTLALIEDRRSLGQGVLSKVRGRIAGEPVGVTPEASQWWFMLGWVMRAAATGQETEDGVIQAFTEITLATGESKVKRNDA